MGYLINIVIGFLFRGPANHGRNGYVRLHPEDLTALTEPWYTLGAELRVMAVRAEADHDLLRDVLHEVRNRNSN